MVPEAGPITPEIAVALRLRNQKPVKWTARCLKCGDFSERTDYWCGLGRKVCSADDPGGVVWRQHRHQLVPVAEGYQCSRCHLPIAAARSERAALARCPAWSLEGQAGVVEGSVQWSAQQAHIGPTWKRDHGGVGRLAPVVGLPERRAPVRADVAVAGGRVSLRPYRDHVLVKGEGKLFCLRCCQIVPARAKGGRGPCPGEGDMRRVVRDALGRGVFDEAILSAGPRAVSLAAGLGRDRREQLPPPRAGLTDRLTDWPAIARSSVGRQNAQSRTAFEE